MDEGLRAKRDALAEVLREGRRQQRREDAMSTPAERMRRADALFELVCAVERRDGGGPAGTDEPPSLLIEIRRARRARLKAAEVSGR